MFFNFVFISPSAMEFDSFSVFFFFVGVRMWAVLPNYKILNLLDLFSFCYVWLFCEKSSENIEMLATLPP